MSTQIQKLTQQLQNMINYAICLENTLDEKACISSKELRNHFEMKSKDFMVPKQKNDIITP